MSDSDKTYDDILQEELALKRLARVDAELVHERRKVLADQEEQRWQWDKEWHEVARPLEVRQEYWRRSFLVTLEALLIRGEPDEAARTKAEENANIIAGAENKP